MPKTKTKSELYTDKIIALMLGDEFKIDLDLFGQYMESAQLDIDQLHTLLLKSLSYLRYEAARVLLFESGGLFEKVMQKFKSYSDVQCLGLLCVAVLKDSSEDRDEDQILIIINAAFNRLKAIGALKKHEGILTAMLVYAIVNRQFFSLKQLIASKLPNLDVLPVFNKRYFPRLMLHNIRFNTISGEKTPHILMNSGLLIASIHRDDKKMINYLLQQRVDHPLNAICHEEKSVGIQNAY